MSVELPPVIAIDGPAASGKGTVAQRVAAALGFHYLDSGALYRLVAFAALRAGANLENDLEISNICLIINIKFEKNEIWLDGEPVSEAIRTETVGNAASQIAALPGVRTGLLSRQRAFREPPGLVADGRDMGSVVFPDATLKIYLTASAEERAKRRYKQLMDKGLGASMATLLRDIRDRDARDSARPVAPLKKGADAIELDTTSLTIEEAAAQVLAHCRMARQAP